MINVDREFEFRISHGGVSGVFLPKFTVVRGALSCATRERLARDCQSLDDQGLEAVVQRALERRFGLKGTSTQLADVKPSDITAAIKANDIGERRTG